MGENKKELYQAVYKNLEEMQRFIDHNHRLLASIMDRGNDETCVDSGHQLSPCRAKEERFKQAIQEAIQTLEESRKSFKSKRLEELRKKLTKVLVDQD